MRYLQFGDVPLLYILPSMTRDFQFFLAFGGD